jgi:DNA-binding transcriptional regulator YiaG
MVTADTIKAERNRLRETQTEFARRFGVDQSTVHRWETNGVSGSITARFVASVLRELAEVEPPTMEAAE